MILELLFALSLIVRSIWSWSTMFLVLFKHRFSEKNREILVTLVSETRPLYPFAWGLRIYQLSLEGPIDWFNWLIMASSLLAWYFIREEDDRWKKRRKKAKEKIALIGGRLRVVPNPA